MNNFRYEFEVEGKKLVFDLPFSVQMASEYEKWRVSTFWSKEPETLYWIGDFDAGKPVVFWDVGANIGLYSLFCAHRVKHATVCAFEPQASTFLRLMQNVYLNDLPILPQFAALSDKDDFNTFHVKNNEPGASGGQLSSDDNFIVKYKLPIIKGNTFIENNPYLCPTHVKIDVDGDELKILEGMCNVLGTVKSILVEANQPEVIDFLQDFGLEVDEKYMALRGAGWERESNTNMIFTRR